MSHKESSSAKSHMGCERMSARAFLRLDCLPHAFPWPSVSVIRVMCVMIRTHKWVGDPVIIRTLLRHIFILWQMRCG